MNTLPHCLKSQFKLDLKTGYLLQFQILLIQSKDDPKLESFAVCLMEFASPRSTDGKTLTVRLFTTFAEALQNYLSRCDASMIDPLIEFTTEP